ncbi:MAG: hypothetical protein U0M60_10240 [Clostridia bacterium]|nr:hypothetical protein [Clostridia bacterium]
MKKILSAVLATLIAIQTAGALAAVTTNDGTFDVYNDFEATAAAYGFTDTTGGGGSYSIVNDDYGKALKVSSVSTHHMFSKAEKPIKEGAFRISFDIKPLDKDVYTFMRLVSRDVDKASAIPAADAHLTFTLDKGAINYFPGMDPKGWWQVSANPREYTVGKWYHIDLYGDFVQRKLYYYVNNELYVIDNMKESFKEIYGFYFTAYDLGSGTKSYLLDNVSFTEATYKNLKPLIDKGAAAPDSVRSQLSIKAADMPFGNNYYDTENMPFSLEIANNSGADVDADGVYRVVDENGQIVWEQKGAVKIKNGETCKEKINATPNAYGMLTIKAEFTDKNTGAKSYFSEEVTGSRTAERNERMGIHTLIPNDPAYAPYIKTFVDGFAKIGFAAQRHFIAWNGFETTKGVYEIQGVYKEEWDNLEGNPLDELYVVAYGNHLYTPTDGHIPETEAELKAWYNYCYNLASQIKDRATYYEIWNEPNLSPNFNPGNTPPEGYVEVLKNAYKAIKAADPDAIIVGISQSNYGTSYVSKVFEAGGGEYMDAVSIHPYMWTQGPEAGQMEFVGNVRKCIDDFGYSHLPLYITEIGWQVSVGLDEQAIYNTQMLILNEVYGHMDKIWMFRYVENDDLNNEGFGFLNSSLETKPFLARRHYMAVANFNRIMNKVKYEETKISDEALPLYRFELKDGRKCIVTWNSSGERKDLSVDLGCNTITVSDLYGNETVYHSADGKYNLNVDKFPCYIMGDIKKCEASGKLFSVDKSEVNVVTGSKAEFILSANSDDYDVTAFAGEKIRIEKTEKLGGGKTKIVVAADNDFTTQESVTVVVSKNEKTCYKARIAVNNVPAVSVKSHVEHYLGNRWNLNIDITNNLYDKAVDGTVYIDGPNEFSDSIKTWKVKPVGAGVMGEVIIPIPDYLGKKDADFKGRLKMSDGTELDLSRVLTFKGMPYMRMTPEFDGVISEGEWNKDYVLKFNGEDANVVHLAGETYRGKDDLDATMYYGWDNKNFYLAAEVYDDCFELDPEKRLWAGDSIQFAYALKKEASANRTEIGVGIGANGPELTKYAASLAPPSDGSRFIHEIAIENYPDKKLTVYELSIPWAEMFPAGFDITDYSQVLFSVMLNDRDNNVREGYIEVGSGIGTDKNPAMFLEYNLLKIK